MKKNSAVFLFALCPLIPAASRLAYGIVLGFELIWIFLIGIVFREIVRKMNAAKASPYIELACIAGSATIFSFILQWFSPTIFISLGLYAYLTAFSYLLLLSIDYFSIEKNNFLPVVPFIPFVIVFSCLREILGTGTISLPYPKGILEITVLPFFSSFGLSFWGTSGGALILLGIFGWASKYLNRRISNFRRSA
jgi:Na+-translocating ferredoxin:NAD+ oxidoreductase RnfE subunit